MSASPAIVNVQQERTRRVGASEAAIALGLSPYESPIALWLRLTGRAGAKVETEPMHWGTKLEGVIRGEYVERHRVAVYVPKESILHPDRPWLGCTPDGIVLRGDDATGKEVWSHTLQIKAPGWFQLPRWGTADDPTVPVEIAVQVQVEMAVCGLPFADVVALIGGNCYVERRIERDLELEHDILTGLDEFMALVDSDTPPPVDESDAYSEYLRDRLAKKSGTAEATHAVNALVGRWRELEVTYKRTEKERDLVKNLVMAEMDKLGATTVKSEHGPIVMQAGQVRYDDKALAQDLCNRLQLRGEAIDFAAERERYRHDGKPFARRPNAWTKE